MHEYVALTQTKSGCACQEKAWHAHEPYVNACGCNMKNWTQNGIVSQTWVEVLIPIVIIVWVGLRLWVLVGVTSATTYQNES